jgi:hypothetical protein
MKNFHVKSYSNASPKILYYYENMCRNYCVLVDRGTGRFWYAHSREAYREGQIFMLDCFLFWRWCSSDMSKRKHVRMARQIYGEDVRNTCSARNANMSFVWVSDRHRWRLVFPADSFAIRQQMAHMSAQFCTVKFIVRILHLTCRHESFAASTATAKMLSAV